MSAVDQLIFGELDGNVSPRVEAFLEVGLKAGFAARASDDITTELWNKFVLIGGFNPVACLSRQPVGPVHSDRDLRALFIRTMEEVAAVGRAKGVALAADIVEKTLAFSERAFSPESKPSMLEDLEIGKPLELEWISGTIARLGDELGVPTPIHHAAYACLKPLANGASGRPQA